MSSILLVNPHKRGTKKRRSKTAHAFAAKRRAPKRHKRRAKAKRRAVAIFANPSRPRGRRRSGHAIMRAMSRRRRNPISLGSMTGVKALAMEAAVGAVGAVGVDMLFQHLPLPHAVKSGVGRHAAKAGLAVALGLVGKKFAPKYAGAAAAGALTVILYNAGRDMLMKQAPARVGEYLGEYLAGDEVASMHDLAAYNAALPVASADGLHGLPPAGLTAETMGGGPGYDSSNLYA